MSGEESGTIISFALGDHSTPARIFGASAGSVAETEQPSSSRMIVSAFLCDDVPGRNQKTLSRRGCVLPSSRSFLSIEETVGAAPETEESVLRGAKFPKSVMTTKWRLVSGSRFFAFPRSQSFARDQSAGDMRRRGNGGAGS